MFPSILTFDFDLFFGSFLRFWGHNELFFGLGKGSKTVLGSTHVVEQLSFCLSLSILIYVFTQFLGLFLIFGALMGHLRSWGWFDNCFRV